MNGGLRTPIYPLQMPYSLALRAAEATGRAHLTRAGERAGTDFLCIAPS
jgi:hypothetical protein